MRKWIAVMFMGAATGSRSMSGLAALVLTTPPAASNQPDRTFGTRAVKIAATSAAIGELVGDKLPMMPSRLKPPGLGARVAMAAAGAQIIARRGPASNAGTGYAFCATAALTALATAWLGARWRARPTPPRDSPLLAALLEDAAAISLAAAAAAIART